MWVKELEKPLNKKNSNYNKVKENIQERRGEMR